MKIKNEFLELASLLAFLFYKVLMPKESLVEIELLNPELPVDYYDSKVSRLDLRVRLQDETELIAMSSKELPEEVRKAFEELKELSKDPAMREVALSREIALRDHYQRLFEAEQRGIEIGEERGIVIGERNAEIKLAKNMKTQGFSIEQIQSVTGLSMEEIESL